MAIRSCAPLCRPQVPTLGIEVYGVGLRWDDDAGHPTRIGWDVIKPYSVSCSFRLRLPINHC